MQERTEGSRSTAAPAVAAAHNTTIALDRPAAAAAAPPAPVLSVAIVP